MSNDYHSHSLFCKILHKLENLAYHLGVKRRGGLVKEHYFGIHSKRAYYRNSLLLSARKLGRILISFIKKTYSVKQLYRLCLSLLLCHQLELKRSKHKVLNNREIVEKIKMLENHSHLLTREIYVNSILLFNLFQFSLIVASLSLFEEILFLYLTDNTVLIRVGIFSDHFFVSIGSLDNVSMQIWVCGCEKLILHPYLTIGGLLKKIHTTKHCAFTAAGRTDYNDLLSRLDLAGSAVKNLYLVIFSKIFVYVFNAYHLL